MWEDTAGALTVDERRKKDMICWAREGGMVTFL